MEDSQFPDGKLIPEDEGSISVAIGIKNGNVIVQFPKPIVWLGLPPADAIEVGRTLIRRAREAIKMDAEAAASAPKH